MIGIDMFYEPRSVVCPAKLSSKRRPCKGLVIRGDTLCCFHKRQSLIFRGDTGGEMKKRWEKYKEEHWAKYSAKFLGIKKEETT